MTPAQEFKEVREWLAQNKRDPFLWLTIIMALLMFTLNFGIIAILSLPFPFSDAKRVIEQLRTGPEIVMGEGRAPCKLPSGTYIFGYDFIAKGHVYSGRICRELVNGRWVVAFDNNTK